MSIKIRGRDGVIRFEDDSYILADGESLLLEMRFMDARRSMIHDGRGNPAGQRPGFLYSDGERAERARVDAYMQYAEEVSERWRGRQNVGNAHVSNQTQPQPQTFANPEAARAAAYAEYNRTIQERWRR